MSNLKITFAFCSFILFPLNVKADFDSLFDSSPSFDSITKTNTVNTSLDNYRNSDNSWGNVGQEAEIDLSEWGGRVPTCAEAPGCPICIN